MDVENVDAASRVQPTPLCCSTRLSIAVIGFFMFFHMYAQRVGMSVAIVSMVNHTAVSKMTTGKIRQFISPIHSMHVLEKVAIAMHCNLRSPNFATFWTLITRPIMHRSTNLAIQRTIRTKFQQNLSICTCIKNRIVDRIKGSA